MQSKGCPFIQAIKANDEVLVRNCMENDEEWHVVLNELNENPIEAASKSGHQRMKDTLSRWLENILLEALHQNSVAAQSDLTLIKKLLSFIDCFNLFLSIEGNTVAHLLVKCGDPELARMMLNKILSYKQLADFLHIKNWDGLNCFELAMNADNWQMMDVLLEHMYPLDIEQPIGSILASRKQDGSARDGFILKAARYIIDTRGINTFKILRRYCREAIQNRDDALFKELLSAAYPQLTEKDIVEVISSCQEAMELTKEFRIDYLFLALIEQRTIDDSSCRNTRLLHCIKNLSRVDIFLAYTDNKSNNPLHLAAKKCDKAALVILVSKCSRTSLNIFNETPIDILINANQWKLVNAFLSAMDQLSNEFCLPVLMKAMNARQVDRSADLLNVIKQLLLAGICPSATSNEAFHIAISNNDLEVLALLLSFNGTKLLWPRYDAYLISKHALYEKAKNIADMNQFVWEGTTSMKGYTIPMLLVAGYYSPNSIFHQTDFCIIYHILKMAVGGFITYPRAEEKFGTGSIYKHYNNDRLTDYKPQHHVNPPHGKLTFLTRTDALEYMLMAFNKQNFYSPESRHLMNVLSHYHKKPFNETYGKIDNVINNFLTIRFSEKLTETPTISLLKRYGFVTENELANIRNKYRNVVNSMIREFDELYMTSPASKKLMQDLYKINNPSQEYKIGYTRVEKVEDRIKDYLHVQFSNKLSAAEDSKTIKLLKQYNFVTEAQLEQLKEIYKIEIACKETDDGFFVLNKPGI